MSNATHTPGPWKFGWEREDKEWGIVTDKSGNIIANVNTETGPDIPPLVSRKMPCVANARFIAAAPDLLAVAIDIKKYLDFVSSGHPTHGTVERELYYRLQAAIAAAKGEK